MSEMLASIKNKYAEFPIQAKASIWFAICSILQKAISILTVPLFTRLMSTEQYGYYTTYISWYNLLLVFTSLNLFYGVFNNAMLKYKSDRAGYISSMQGLVFTLTSSVFVIYVVFQERINAILGMSRILVLMLFLELLLTPSLQFWMAAKRFDYQYKSIVLVTLIKSIANPVLGLFLVIASEQKDVARILSIVLTETCICGIITALQFYRGKIFFSKDYWKFALLFNLPLLPHYLSGQILNQSDRIMIGHMINQSAVAKYGVAYNIGLLLNIFTNAVNGSFTPWFYQAIEKKEYEVISGVVKIIIRLMLALVTLLMLFGPEAIAILGSAEYKEGMYCIPPVAASAFFIFLYNIYANIEFYYEKKYYVLFSSVVAAALNLILNVIFIRHFGYVAAAYTTLACYCVYCYLHSFFARRICDKEDIPKAIFGGTTPIAAAIAVVAICICMSFLYSNTILRFLLIGSSLCACLIFKRKIVSSMSNVLKTIKK